MRAWTSISIALAAALALGSAKAADHAPRMEVLVVTAKRPALEPADLVTVAETPIEVDAAELTRSPPRVEHPGFSLAPAALDGAGIDTGAPHIELVLADDLPSKS